jgi:hypothetical protein
VRETQISRDPENKGRWVLPDVGAVRFPRRWKNEVLIEVPGELPWKSNGKALSKGTSEAVDTGGQVRATFHREGGAGRITYGDRGLAVTGGETSWTERRSPLALTEGGRELISFESVAWGRRPIRVTIADERAVAADPQLILFGAYAAHLLCTRPQMLSAAS